MTIEEKILEGLDNIQSQVTRMENKFNMVKVSNFNGKNVLTLSETSDYTGFSQDYIYRHRIEIGYSKPNSKNIFFEKTKIDSWLLRGMSKSQDEINKEVTKNVIWGNGKQKKKL